MASLTCHHVGTLLDCAMGSCHANSLVLKNQWFEHVLLGWSIFRGYVRFGSVYSIFSKIFVFFPKRFLKRTHHFG